MDKNMGPENKQFLPDPNPRRQDKIIAAVLRHNPKLLLQEQVKLDGEERARYLRRVGRGEIQGTHIKGILSVIPTPLDIQPNKEEPKAVFAKIAAGDRPERHQRRVVAHFARGDSKQQDQLGPRDLFRVVRKYATAYDFERALPEYVKAVEQTSVPKDRIKARTEALKAAHEVGALVYGNQWGYLQQARLLDAEAAKKPATVTSPKKEPVVFKKVEVKAPVKAEAPKKVEIVKPTQPEIPTAELVPQPGVQLKDQLNQILSKSSAGEQRVVAGVDRLVDYIKTIELPANARIINPQYQFTPEGRLRLSAGVHAEKKVLWTTQTVDTDFWAILANSSFGLVVVSHHVGDLGMAELFRGKIEQHVADLGKKIREKVSENTPGWEVANFRLTEDRKLAFDFRRIPS